MIILKTKHQKNIIILLSSRGWRIQWSIVPEVSEPMVSWLRVSMCQQENTCGSGGHHAVPLIHVCFLRSLQRKTWQCLRSSSLCLMWPRKRRYSIAPQSVSTNGETALVHVVIELFSTEPVWEDGGCVGEDQKVSQSEKSPYWIIKCGFIKWGTDKCLFVCMYMSASSCGCSRRAPGSSTSACGWLSSAPASCRTSLWASWSVRGVHNTHRQSSFILRMYCSAWKNAHTYMQSSAHKQMHSCISCVTVLSPCEGGLQAIDIFQVRMLPEDI